MAKSSVVVDGDISAATRLCADAIKAAGGNVSSSIPDEPVRFSIKRPGSWRDNRNTPYDGTAGIVAITAAQSRVDVETTLAGIFYVYMGLTCVGCLLLTALFWYIGILPLIFAIIACVYLTVMWRRAPGRRRWPTPSSPASPQQRTSFRRLLRARLLRPLPRLRLRRLTAPPSWKI